VLETRSHPYRAFRARAAHVATSGPRTPRSARPAVPTRRGRPCFALPWRTTGGTSGGTPGVKDQEIRVRTGNSRFRQQPRRGRANGDVSKTCVENKGFVLAPQVQHRNEHPSGESSNVINLFAVNRNGGPLNGGHRGVGLQFSMIKLLESTVP